MGMETAHAVGAGFDSPVAGADLLGTAESVLHAEELFTPLDASFRLYTKRRTHAESRSLERRSGALP